MSGRKSNIVALDSNIFIYHFENNEKYIPYTTRLFSAIVQGKNHGITSIISVIETLSFPASEKLIRDREEDFKSIPNFTIYNITWEISLKAAEIRRKYGFRLPDATQLATAKNEKADIFITNDERLKNFPEVKVTLLSEYHKSTVP